MVILSWLSVTIGGYFITSCWWLFYSWLLVFILFMVIGGYFIMVIGDYWWLLC
jgi:hypothetical protein